ncbi:hypothetical protein [uncultured Roseibium sp.]|uniref:hypothetical protein n=1 Tax=uncultured Roseibium sp. TaxID=1936171 RepID=UPI002625523A|nr:hypothetical protein [uncultured Roseibium sp.]
MRIAIFFSAMMLGFTYPSDAAPDIYDHFLGENPVCVSRNQPIIIVADVSRDGEIDDTVSIALVRRLEESGCVEILAAVSIFGNSNSSTNEVHDNLIVRLGQLGIDNWMLLHGPDRRMSFDHNGQPTPGDLSYLKKIAQVIKGSSRAVTLLELGPTTVAASLLRYGLVPPRMIAKIIGVGGRSPGEHFATGRGFRAFALRDMNVAMDVTAIAYLVRNHPGKLNMVTYRAGVGERVLSPELAESFSIEAIAEHARKRSRMMKFLGYTGLPSWDTWAATLFVTGGAERIGCRETPARVIYDDSGTFKQTDSMQLQLLKAPDRYSRTIIAC